MTRGTRLLLAILIGGIVLAAATVGAAAAAVYRAGTLAVEIRTEDGNQIQLNLPAGLLRTAIAVAPSSLLEQARDELEPLLPALHEGWRELTDTPDFVLIELHSTDENVRVEKIGSQLLIFVEMPDVSVRVGIPLDTVGSVLRKLG